MSVASEKTSRVMETLIVSTKPSRILLGKCIAMGTLGLIQLSIFILAAALGYNLLIPDDFTISGVPLALSSFTPASALLILVYFLLGYALFAMINSVCGAVCHDAVGSDQHDFVLCSLYGYVYARSGDSPYRYLHSLYLGVYHAVSIAQRERCPD
jgi:hypothetical protein